MRRYAVVIVACLLVAQADAGLDEDIKCVSKSMREAMNESFFHSVDMLKYAEGYTESTMDSIRTLLVDVLQTFDTHMNELDAAKITKGRLQIAIHAIRGAQGATFVASRNIQVMAYDIDCQSVSSVVFSITQGLTQVVEAAWDCFGEGF